MNFRPCTLCAMLLLCFLGATAQSSDSVKISVTGGTAVTTSNTLGNVPSTLQLTATVYPATISQSVTWSVLAGNTANGSISSTGLLTVNAQTSGYIWVKATSVADISQSDSIKVLVYCKPSHTNPLNWFNIDTVRIQGTSLNSGTTSAGNAGAYVFFPASGNTTATLHQASTYSIYTHVTSLPGAFAPDTTLYTYSVSAWIDYNRNGVFEPSEWIQVEDSALSRHAQYNVSIPSTAAPGHTLMRVRVRLFGSSNGIADMCLGYTGSGQTEDYIVTIAGQPAQTVDSVTVAVLNNAPPAITSNAGTLQMAASVFPATVNQNVTWTIVPGSGTASISPTGTVTAQTNGTVWAKAVSVQDITQADSLQISISGQIVPVDSVIIATQGNVTPAITTNAGILQMVSTVYPLNTLQNVNWNIIPVSGNANITPNGLISAIADGTVWAKATSQQDMSKSDSMLITISGQIIPIDSIRIHTQGNIPAVIHAPNGTIQLEARVYPVAASQTITWSIAPATGNATIDNMGLVTASSDGTVWAKATSVHNTVITDSLLITINGQTTGVTKLSSGYGLQIYPNPARHSIFIKAARKHTAISASIYDMSGKHMGRWDIGADVSTIPFRLNTESFAPGMYLLKFGNNEIQECLMFEIE